MTPAIKLLSKKGIEHRIHSYSHDQHQSSYGLEAAEKLGIEPTRVFKTLIVKLDGRRLACAILPVAHQMSLKLVARALEAKKAVMAETAEAERATGYVLGGISPLGQKTRLAFVLDQTAYDHSTIFISAGKRGLEIELSPEILASQLAAARADIVAKA